MKNLRKKNVIFFISFCISVKHLASASNCTVDTDIGPNYSNSFNSLKQGTDPDTGETYVFIGQTYNFTCCGVIKEWKYRSSVSGPGPHIGYFQVWRGPVPGGHWTLVGHNQVTVPSTGFLSEIIATGNKVSVKTDDVIGLHFPGDSLITFSNSGSSLFKSTSSFTLGDTSYDWNSVTNGNRDIAITAIVEPGINPSFTNLDSTVVVHEGEVTYGKVVKTLAVTGDEQPSFLSTSLTGGTNTSLFLYNPSNLQVMINVAPISEGIYYLNFEVTTPCGKFGTGVLRVVLSSALTIINLPGSYSVNEDVTTETLLYTIETVNSAGPVTCSSSSTSPFFVQNINPTSDNGVYVQNSPNLDYHINNQYTVTVNCTNGTDTASGVLTINILPSEIPVINNLPSSYSLSEDASSELLLYTLNITDVTNTITCSVVDPAGAPFLVKAIAGASDLGIYVQNNPGLDYNVTQQYILTINCTNSHSSTNGTFTVNVLKNIAPTIHNLPGSYNLPEAQTTELLMLQLNVTDPTDNITCGLNDSGSALFEMQIISGSDFGIYVKSGASFDYDITSQYVLTVLCNDTRSTVSGLFTVNIMENIGPTIHNLPGTYQIVEDQFTELLLLTLNVTDPTDNVTCFKNSAFDPFILKEYGIYVKVNPGLDYDVVSQYNLTVFCNDTFGNTISGVFTVNIVENVAPTIHNLPSNYSVLESQADEMLMLTLNVTDPENNVTCSLVNVTLSQFSVKLISGTTDYGVYIQSGASFNFDTINQFIIQIQCNDTRTSVTGLFTVNILDNVGPTIHNLPGTYELGEDQATELLLLTLNVTDPTDNVTCFENSTFDPFILKDYGIYVKKNPGLDYDVSSQYNLTVFCNDTFGNSISGVFTVNIVENIAPTIHNLPSNYDVIESQTDELLMLTLNVTDPENNATCFLVNVTLSQFSVKLISGTTDYGIHVQSGATFNYDVINQYTLQIDCNDTRTSVTGLFTVNILENVGPTIHNLPETYQLGEDQATELLLLTLNVTDPTDNVTCFENTTFDPFILKDYGIYVKENPGLDYDVSSQYNLTVYCNDTFGNSISGVFTVNIVENVAPTIHNLPSNYSVLESQTAELLMLTLNVTDPDSNISCTLVNSTLSQFSVKLIQGATDYGIYIQSGASFNYDVINTYTLHIECNDTRTTVTGLFTVHILDNVGPTIHNLPGIYQLGEDQATELLLLTLNITDPTDNVTCFENTTFDPFILKDYGIYVKENPGLDYDVSSQYNLTVYCNDTFSNSISGVFTVNIVENVAPTIHNLPSNYSVLESQTDELLMLTLNVTDPEGNVTCFLTNSTLWQFSVELIQGTIDYGIYIQSGASFNYDVINQYTLQIECNDTRTTVTGLFTVNILDNVAPTIHNLPGTYLLDEDQSTELLLLTLNVTDPTDNVTCFENTTFNPFILKDYGISVKENPTLDYDIISQYNLTVYCNDTFGNSISGVFTVNIVENVAPTIHNLPSNYSVLESQTDALLMFTLNVTDPEGNVTCFLANSTLLQFSVEIIQGTADYGIHIQSGASFNYDVINQYTLQVECNDTRTTVTGLFTVNIMDNVAPTIHNFPGTYLLDEDQSTELLLLTLNVTDPTDNVTCFENTTFDPFMLKDYGIYVKENPGLDYDVFSQYNLTVYCNDTFGNSVSGVFTVNIVENVAPTIHNLPSNYSLLESQTAELLMITLNVTDPESNVTCILANSTLSQFTVTLIEGMTDYGVYVQSGASFNYDVINQYTLHIECNDTRTTVTGLFTVNVLDNVAPTIQNLPGTYQLGEDQATELLLLTLNVTDPTDNVTCYEKALFDPFILKGFGIYVKENPGFDYDVSSQYNLTIFCNDTFVNSISGVFTVNIVENIAPAIHNLPSNYSVLESQAAELLMLTLNVTDPDSNITCTLVNSTLSQFSVKLVQGMTDYGIYVQLGASFNYDVINQYTLYIECNDTRTTVTGQFTVNILDNIAPTIHNLPETYQLGEDQATELLLLTLNVTDPTDNVTCFENSTFDPFMLKDYGIYVKENPGLDYDVSTQYNLTVYCNDTFGNSVSGVFTVNIVENVAPTIHNLPSNYSVLESKTTELLMLTLNVTDPEDNVTCILANLTLLQFTVKIILQSTDYGIYIQSGASFNYDVINQYPLQIECNDTRTTVTGLFTVNILDNVGPTIHNLPGTVSLREDQSSETLLIALNVSDPTDNVTCVLYPTSVHFELKDISGNDYGIYVKDQPGFDYDTVSQYNLTIYCNDTFGNGVTGVYTVDLLQNFHPTIHNLPATYNLSETQTIELLLLTLNVTDPEDNVTCSLINSSSLPFFIQIINGTSDYGIYLKTSPGLDYDAIQQYLLSVICNDTFTGTTTEIFTVNILQNQPPIITNIAVIEYLILIKDNLTEGTDVYTVNATDPEGYQVYNNLTCSGSDCPFNISAGVISTTTNLANSTVNSFTIYVYAFDGITLSGPKTVVITLIEINKAPTISNLPANINVTENSALGLSVFQISILDDNAADNHTCYITSGETTYFSIDSSKCEILTSAVNNIDFEALSDKTVVLTISVSDGDITVSNNLTITITDVNDPPVFHQLSYSISGDEGVENGILSSPNFNVTDQDGDILFFSMNCGTYNDSFVMNITSGEVSFISSYDADTNPSTVVCTVLASDGLLSNTATLTISVNYINEFDPVFSQSAYTFGISPYTGASTVIGNVAATDADTGDHGTLSYVIDQSSAYSSYFSISENGDLLLQTALSSIDYNNTITLTAIVIDGGGRNASVNITINIAETTTSTTTTTTDRYITFWEDPKNILWVTLTMCLIVTAVCIIAYLVYGFCTTVSYSMKRSPSTDEMLNIETASSCYSVTSSENSRLNNWFRVHNLQNNFYQGSPMFNQRHLFQPKKPRAEMFESTSSTYSGNSLPSSTGSWDPWSTSEFNARF